MKQIVSGVTIECVRGNIAAQHDITAVVNAANAWLRPGGGVAGAIHRAAGSGLDRECRPLAPIKPGDAVITAGHKLPNRYVIHCLGPVYGTDEPASEILGQCYKNALKIAEQKKIDSIAFPAIATGAFGYPIEEAAEVAFKEIIGQVPGLRYLRKVRFVLYDKKDLAIHENVLQLLLSEKKK
jgi:O-acetyl-ADP-ribose deacetylase (regulator of RNase III)